MRLLAIITALAAITITIRADDPPRIRVLAQTWDVNQTSDRKSMPISIYQGERVELTLTAKRGGALIAIPSNAAPVWTLHDWDVTGTWLTVTGSVSSTATGVLEYVIQPAQSGGLPPGSYRAFCSVTGGVIAAQSLVVLPSALATNYPPLEYVNTYLDALAVAESNLIAESTTRLAVDATLTSNITSVSNALIIETNERASAVSMISSNIASVVDALATETNTRQISISEVSSNIAAEASTRSDAVSAITGRLSSVETTALTSVSCSGGWYHPDWFQLELKPYPYHIISQGTTQAQNSVYVNTITVDSAAGYLLSPDILRMSTFTGDVAYTALSNCSIERVAITNYGWDGYSTQQWDVVIFDPDLATGTVSEITATLNGFSRSTQLVYVASNLYSYYQYQGDVAGSLRAYINTSLAARASNTNKSIKLFNDGWPTTWIRNTNCWIGDINLTCASPYNTQDNCAEKGGTAITRQHVVYADHYSFTNNARLLFVDATNGLHWRAIVDQRTVLRTDARIGLLNEPLPDTITPAMLMQPSDNGRFLGALNMSGGIGIRAIHLKAVDPVSLTGPKVFAKWACYAAVVGADTTSGMLSPNDVPIGRTVANHPFSYGAIGGDSGQPTVIVIGTNVVLYSTFYSSAGGPSIGCLAPNIEAAIVEMGNSIYTNLHYINLSEWRDYSLPPPP